MSDIQDHPVELDLYKIPDGALTPEVIAKIRHVFPPGMGIVATKRQINLKNPLSPVTLRSLKLATLSDFKTFKSDTMGFVCSSSFRFSLASLFAMMFHRFEKNPTLLEIFKTKIQLEMTRAFALSLAEIDDAIRQADRRYGKIWNDLLGLHGVQQDILTLALTGRLAFQDQFGTTSSFQGHSIRHVAKLLIDLHDPFEVFKELAPNSPFLHSGFFSFPVQVFSTTSDWSDLILIPRTPWSDTGGVRFEIFQDVVPRSDLPDVILESTTLKQIDSLLASYKRKVDDLEAERLTFLFRGDSGTGKSLLAETIAMKLGKKLLKTQLAEVSSELLPDLVQLAIHRAKVNNQVLLFEECDRLLWSTSSSGLSPAWMKVLFEEGAFNGIAIFVTNGSVGNDFLRRITYPIEFKNHTTAQRAKILTQHLERLPDTFGKLPADAIATLANRYEVPAGFFQQTLQLASALGNRTISSHTLEQSLVVISKNLGLKRTPDQAPPEQLVLEPSAKKSYEDLFKVANKVLSGKSEFCTCASAVFYGPSGTGKSLAARSLAARLGLKVTTVTPGDVLSKYVGENESRVRAIFDKARQEKTLLFFDEAESLFQHREGADRPWINSLTNELLRQTEDFSGVLVLATNDLQAIDAAFARRLLFHISFTTPNRIARKALWATWKNELELTDDDVAELSDSYELTGGEITRIARQSASLGDIHLSTIKALCRQMTESLWKETGRKRMGI